VLAPVVLGVTYFTASRLVQNLPPLDLEPWLELTIAAVCWLGLIALNLSRTTAEIYHVRRPEAQFDTFPVDESAFLDAAVLSRIARSPAMALLLVGGRLAIAGSRSLAGGDWIAPIAVLIILTAFCDVFGALNWIHWAHRRDKLTAAASLAVLLLVSGVAGALALSILFSRSLCPSWLVLVTGAALAGVLYVASRMLHREWRWRDIEYARRLGADAKRVTIPRLLVARLSSACAAQVARDLRLTVRGFSSALFVVVGLAILWPAALVVALKTLPLATAQQLPSWLDATWLPQVVAIKVACVIETCTIAALVPLLVAHELPRFWLERATGATGFDIWQAKLWYSRLVTLSGSLVTCAAGVATFTTPAYYTLPMIAECLWLWWMVSSIVGAFAFEMPTRPVLALVLLTTVGLALGAIAALAWPAGLIVYVQAIGSLRERGRHRARYYLLTEAE